MNKTNINPTFSRNLAVLGLLGTIAVPTTSIATTPSDPAPIAADADPDCEQSTVQLEVDVATGDVYLVDFSTGNLELTDNDINIYFGSLGDVLIKIHYSSSDWLVGITPEGDPPVTYQTTNGWVRYSISPDFESYTFSSTEVSSMSASTMMNMTPVLPDIVLRPKKTCPPPT